VDKNATRTRDACAIANNQLFTGELTSKRYRRSPIELSCSLERDAPSAGNGCGTGECALTRQRKHSSTCFGERTALRVIAKGALILRAGAISADRKGDKSTAVVEQWQILIAAETSDRGCPNSVDKQQRAATGVVC